jgi:hypothetical protein
MSDSEIKQRHQKNKGKEPAKKVDEEDTKKLKGYFFPPHK